MSIEGGSNEETVPAVLNELDRVVFSFNLERGFSPIADRTLARSSAIDAAADPETEPDIDPETEPAPSFTASPSPTNPLVVVVSGEAEKLAPLNEFLVDVLLMLFGVLELFGGDPPAINEDFVFGVLGNSESFVFRLTRIGCFGSTLIIDGGKLMS